MRDCELFTICFTRGHLPWIHRQCLFYFFLCFFVLVSHNATFLEEPVACQGLSWQSITLALGGPEPFLRFLLHNEGSGFYFYLFLFLI